jgi:hypothetical protein
MTRRGTREMVEKCPLWGRRRKKGTFRDVCSKADHRLRGIAAGGPGRPGLERDL